MRSWRTTAANTASLVAVAALVAATLLVAALTVGPRLLPYRTYAITGGSMEPTLPLGSEAVLRPVRAEHLRVGDIITFERPDGGGGLVTHRIVRVEHDGAHRFFVTQGDANAVPDDWRVNAAGQGWRYAFSLPYAGFAVEVLRLPLARLALLALVAAVLATTLLRRVWSAPEPL